MNFANAARLAKVARCAVPDAIVQAEPPEQVDPSGSRLMRLVNGPPPVFDNTVISITPLLALWPCCCLFSLPPRAPRTGPRLAGSHTPPGSVATALGLRRRSV